MAKRIVRDQDGKLSTESNTNYKFFHGRAEAFTNLTEFKAIMDRGSETGGAVIHGELVPGQDTTCMLRRSATRPGEPATIRDRLCPYIVLDIDKLPLPPGLSALTDPDGVVQAALDCLPDELRDVSCYFHHSHSAGTSESVKLHLAFLLETAMRCHDLKRWVQFQNEALGFSLLDPAPYTPEHLVLIGNPQLAPGVADPVPAGKRSGLVTRKHEQATLEVPAGWRSAGSRTNLSQQADIRQFTGVGINGVSAALKRFPDACHGAIMGAVNAAYRARQLLVDKPALVDRIETAFDSADWVGTGRTDAYLAKERDDIARTVDYGEVRERGALEGLEYGVPSPRFATAAPAVAEMGAKLDAFITLAEKWHRRATDDEDDGDGAEGTAGNDLAGDR